MLTVQKVLQKHSSEYLRTHKLPLYQLKGVSSLLKCRTSVMGGHALYCDNGHFNGCWYNSCGHRSCAQCGALKRVRWQAKVESILLDSAHHHWVFTLPHELHEIWNYNRELCQKLLFESVRKTLQVLSADKRYLGAKLGAVLALHTWARNLTFHPHIHCLVTHGGIKDESWVEPKRKILFPVKVMTKLFRGKYLAGLKSALSRGELVVPDTKIHALNLLNKWGRQHWVIHCAKRYEHGRGVTKYLARYIRGGALKNSQLLQCNEKAVKYRYWSHERQKKESVTLSPSAFIGRLVSHIAYPRKQQYHFVGIYHNRSRKHLECARVHHGQQKVKKSEGVSWQSFMAESGREVCCEKCGGAVTRLVRFRSFCDFLKITK